MTLLPNKATQMMAQLEEGNEALGGEQGGGLGDLQGRWVGRGCGRLGMRMEGTEPIAQSWDVQVAGQSSSPQVFLEGQGRLDGTQQ